MRRDCAPQHARAKLREQRAGRRARTSRGGTGRRRRARARPRSTNALAVLGRAEHVRRVGRVRRERVHVVEGRAGPAARRSAREARSKRTTFQPMCGSFRPPARRSGRTLAAQQPEARARRRARPSARTAAACRGRCRAAARPSAGRSRDQLVEAQLAQVASIAFGNAPTPGTHEAVGAAQLVVVARQTAAARRRARAPSRPSGGCPCRSRRSRSRTPLTSASPSCDGTPVSVGSSADGRAQRARERLEAAPRSCGARWCRPRPRRAASASRWSPRRGRTPRPARGRSRAIAPGGRSALEGEERAPGDVDRARRARLVHRHDRLPVADDPGAVAERLVERLPERDAGVLDRVVRARSRGRPCTCTSRSRRPWRASRSSMWSRKPTPVARAPVAGAVERQRQADVGLAGLRGRSRRCGSSRAILPMRASIDSACTAKPSARAIVAPGAGQRGGRAGRRSAPRAMRRRKCRAESAGGEARGAARRQHVVGAGDVVAERGAARGADEQAAGARHRAAPAPRRPRPSAPGARARTPPRSASAPSRSAASTSTAAPASGASAQLRGERVEHAPTRARRATTRLSGPCSAWASRSSATSSGSASRASTITSSSLGPAKPSIPTSPRRPGAWPPARSRLPGPTITSTRPARSRCRRPARRSPARRPCR